MENLYLRAFLFAVAAMSALTFFLFALDKLFAVRNRWRIRERTLIACLWLFGAPGGLLSMSLFRHKTKHASFWINGLLALLAQVAIAWWIVYRFGR